MADFNGAALPVRTFADADERLQTKLVDFTTPAQGATIDADGLLHIEVHGDNPAGADETLRLSELGSASVDGVYSVSDNSDPSNVGLVASVRAASPADTDQTQRLTAVTNGNKRLLDVSIHDEAGDIFSDTNPLPVYMAADPGTEVQSYDTQASLASGGTDNHDYAVASGIFELHQVYCSATGKGKYTVQWSSDGVAFTTLAVGFGTAANPNVDIKFARPYNRAGSGTALIRVIRQNNENQSQDVYSTIVGVLK